MLASYTARIGWQCMFWSVSQIMWLLLKAGWEVLESSLALWKRETIYGKTAPKSRAPDIPKGSLNPHRQKTRGDLVRINQEHNSKRFLQPLYFIPTVDIHTLLDIYTSRECWCRGWCTGISRGTHMGIHCACWSWRHGEWVHQDQDQDYQDYTQNEYKFTLRINTSLDGIVEKKYKCSTMSILRWLIRTISTS